MKHLLEQAKNRGQTYIVYSELKLRHPWTPPGSPWSYSLLSCERGVKESSEGQILTCLKGLRYTEFSHITVSQLKEFQLGMLKKMSYPQAVPGLNAESPLIVSVSALVYVLKHWEGLQRR